MKYNERIVLAFFENMDIPKPELEFVFDPTRKWRFDFAWPSDKIALEVEGGVWSGGRHTHPSGFIKDIEKYNRAAYLGWRVFRCTPRDLCTMETVKLIKQSMMHKWELTIDRDTRWV
jgi:hypothetical protein